MSVRREKRRDPNTGAVREFYLVDVVVQTPDGKERRERKVPPVQTRRAARQYERQLRQALLDGTYQQKEEAKKEAPTLKQFTEDFVGVYARNNNRPSEIESKESICRCHLVPALGKKRLDQIGPRDVERYKAAKLKAGLSPKSINNQLAVLGRMLNVAVDWEVLDHAPRMKWLQVPEQPYDFFDFAEAERLVAATKGEDRAMVVTALKTGLRLGELRAIRWADVDLGTGRLVVRRSLTRGLFGPPKGKRSREIPLSPEAVRTLKGHRHLRGELVFGGPDGDFLTKDEVRGILARACRRAGLRAVGWHCLRHTFASHLVMKGVALKAVQELLGHTTIGMTMRYSHLSPVVHREAVCTLDDPVVPSDPVHSHGNMAATGTGDIDNNS